MNQFEPRTQIITMDFEFYIEEFNLYVDTVLSYSRPADNVVQIEDIKNPEISDNMAIVKAVELIEALDIWDEYNAQVQSDFGVDEVWT